MTSVTGNQTSKTLLELPRDNQHARCPCVQRHAVPLQFDLGHCFTVLWPPGCVGQNPRHIQCPGSCKWGFLVAVFLEVLLRGMGIATGGANGTPTALTSLVMDGTPLSTMPGLKGLRLWWLWCTGVGFPTLPWFLRLRTKERSKKTPQVLLALTLQLLLSNPLPHNFIFPNEMFYQHYFLKPSMSHSPRTRSLFGDLESLGGNITKWG